MAGYKDLGWVYNIRENIYYVYALFDLNGFPFYIGKGKGQRVNNHVKPSLLTDHSHKNHKIKTILEQQGYLKREILAYCEKEVDAYALEENLIVSYGLRSEGGCLTNIVLNNKELSKKAISKKDEKVKNKRQSRVSDEYILKAYHKYKTDFIGIEVLASGLGISASYLNHIFSGRKRKDLQLVVREERPVTVKVTSSKAFDVITDRKLGMSYGEIMTKHKLPKTTVARICSGVGVYSSLWTKTQDEKG